MSGHARPPLDFDAPVESVDELVEYLRGGEKPPEHWRVDDEEYWPLYDGRMNLERAETNEELNLRL